MADPKVRLLLKGEPVQEIAFDKPSLRIGRMKENDLVINNLSVSRFHATLARAEDGGFVLEDLGSENGVWVNGRRVKSCRVAPGDRVQVGKHEIQIVEAGDAGPAPAPPGRSDAWDAAATYVAGPDTQARMAEAAQAAPPRAPEDSGPSLDIGPLDTDGELAPPPAAGEQGVVPSEEGASLFGEVEAGGTLAAPDLAEFDVSELDLREPEEAPAPAPEPATVVFDASPGEAAESGEPLDDDEPATLLVEPDAPAEPTAPVPELELDAAPEPALAPPPPPIHAAPAADPAAATAAGGQHAGLILQRGGRLERVIQWESDRMTLGRAAECDIVLATPEVSRRHAMLVREGGRFEVRDLESINGTHVNGEKVSRRALEVGDVVKIEDFELTFVLERAPVGTEVKAEAPRAGEAVAGAPDPNLTQIGEMMDLAPFVAEDSPAESAGAMSFDPLPDDPFAEELGAVAEPEPETVLLSEAPDEEKELVDTPREARVLRLELRVRMDELPPALREALSGLDPADLRLPAELRLATEDEL